MIEALFVVSILLVFSLDFVGAVIGGLVAAGSAAVDANQQKKATDPNRPKRRRLAKLQETVGQAINNKQRALIAMAQAHQNFASMW